MKKEISIIMLPTEKEQYGKYLVVTKHGINVWDTQVIGSQRTLNPQHLYFLSDEKIEIGDWYLTDNNKVLQATDLILGLVYAEGDHGRQVRHCKKIIATTDPKLQIPKQTSCHECNGKGITNSMSVHLGGAEPDVCEFCKGKSTEINIHILPRPSNEFLKKYCELGGVSSVLVEYDEIQTGDKCSGCGDSHPMNIYSDSGHGCKYCGCFDLSPLYKLQLKVAPDNTISIYPINS